MVLANGDCLRKNGDCLRFTIKIPELAGGHACISLEKLCKVGRVICELVSYLAD